MDCKDILSMDKTLMAASCSGFRTMCLPFCERDFDASAENSKTPSNASSDSATSILILLCSGRWVMQERQISDVVF